MRWCHCHIIVCQWSAWPQHSAPTVDVTSVDCRRSCKQRQHALTATVSCYCKTLIFHVHTIFVNFASSIKSQNYIPAKIRIARQSWQLLMYLVTVLLLPYKKSSSNDVAIYNSVHIAKVAWKEGSQRNAKLKCSKISTLQNRQIKTQLKCSVLQ